MKIRSTGTLRFSGECDGDNYIYKKDITCSSCGIDQNLTANSIVLQWIVPRPSAAGGSPHDGQFEHEDASAAAGALLSVDTAVIRLLHWHQVRPGPGHSYSAGVSQWNGRKQKIEHSQPEINSKHGDLVFSSSLVLQNWQATDLCSSMAEKIFTQPIQKTKFSSFKLFCEQIVHFSVHPGNAWCGCRQWLAGQWLEDHTDRPDGCAGQMGPRQPPIDSTQRSTLPHRLFQVSSCSSSGHWTPCRTQLESKMANYLEKYRNSFVLNWCEMFKGNFLQLQIRVTCDWLAAWTDASGWRQVRSSSEDAGRRNVTRRNWQGNITSQSEKNWNCHEPSLELWK